MHVLCGSGIIASGNKWLTMRVQCKFASVAIDTVALSLPLWILLFDLVVSPFASCSACPNSSCAVLNYSNVWIYLPFQLNRITIDKSYRTNEKLNWWQTFWYFMRSHVSQLECALVMVFCLENERERERGKFISNWYFYQRKIKTHFVCSSRWYVFVLLLFVYQTNQFSQFRIFRYCTVVAAIATC